MESCQVTIKQQQQQQQQKIEFHGVRSTYPTGDMVNCYFTVPTQYRPEVGDWIGIYPVGWSSLVAHCLCKKYIKPENVWSTPVGQQYGKVEFDGEYLQMQLPKFNGVTGVPVTGEQFYQFVYVKNGQCIHGASTPFMFVAQPTTTVTTGTTVQPIELTGTTRGQLEEIVFGGKPFGGMMSLLEQQQRQPEQWYQQQQQQQQPRNGEPRTTLEQVVEREMQKLQNGIFGLEQGLVGYKTVFPLIEETFPQQWNKWTQQQQQQPSTTEIMTELLLTQQQQQQQQQPMQPHQIKKHWQQRIGEVQQMLGEQIRLEQAQRRIEQLNMLAQLKGYERHIQQVQRKELEINEYLRTVKIQKQIAEFEQKVYNVMKLSGEIQQQQQQPEHYVRKYEQLLKEKVELDIQKRIAILHKLRQTIKECERKLREIQSGEQQHYTRFHQILKTRIGQFETKFFQQQQQQTVGLVFGSVEQELREQLKQLVGQLINEQRKEQYEYIKSQKQMQYLCQEIAQRLQELECQEIYTQLRIQKIGGQQQQQQYFNFYPQYEQHYTQVQQLEQQLNELKQTLRQKMYQQQGQYTTVQQQQQQQQLLTVEWIKTVAQKLRELEWTLRQEKMMLEINGECQLRQPVQWFERRIQNLTQHLKYFEIQMEQQPQPFFQFEEYKQREVLGQLRQLEAELCEFPFNYKQQQHHQQQQQQQYRQIVELCQYLKQIIREKISQLNSIEYGCYEPSPIECFIQTGSHSAWKQMMQFERKLVQLKGMIVERQQYQQLQQKLNELEHFVQQQQQQQKKERCQEQIRQLRQMLEQHQQQWQQQQWQQQQQLQQQLLCGTGLPVVHQQHQPQQWQHWSVVPEQFVQHQQKYERLCQLVAELEGQLIGEQQQVRIPMYNVPQEQQQCHLYLIQQRFERLIKEFQQRVVLGQPKFETSELCKKIEQIAQYLQKELKQQQQKPFYFGQQLREKIVEFETILAEQQPEQWYQPQQQCWTQQQQQQQQPIQYIKLVGKQVRELKQQIQAILNGEQQQQQQQQNGEWVLVNNGEFVECDYNNNGSTMTTFATPSFYETSVEQQLQEELVDFLSARQLTGEYEQPSFIPRYYRQPQYETYQQQQRKLEQLERLFEQEQQQQQQQEQLESELFYFPTQQQQQQQQGLRSLLSVENLIGELESELVKLRLQKECQKQQQQQQQQVYQPTATTRLVLTTPESVCEEISKIVGQNLLTTVVPTIVKVTGQQQQQEKTVFVEPTQYQTTTTTQCVKVQQQQQQRESTTQF